MIEVCVYYKNDSYFYYGKANSPLSPNLGYIRVFCGDSDGDYQALVWSSHLVYRIIKQ